MPSDLLPVQYLVEDMMHQIVEDVPRVMEKTGVMATAPGSLGSVYTSLVVKVG